MKIVYSSYNNFIFLFTRKNDITKNDLAPVTLVLVFFFFFTSKDISQSKPQNNESILAMSSPP